MSTTLLPYRPTTTTASPDSLRQSTLKKNMSITQTYYLAHKARAKLSREAAQADHNLRLLVGHANLLDSLMLELADAEREQERWFNQSVRNSNTPHQEETHQKQERHIQWADTVASVAEEEYDSDSSSESDDDYDEDINMTYTATKAIPTALAVTVEEQEDEDEDIMDDDLEDDYAQLGLVRTHSHSASPQSPPELVDELDSSDDEAMPPSPPQEQFIATPMSSKDAAAAKEEAEEAALFEDEEYYLPQRTPASLVSTISVY